MKAADRMAGLRAGGKGKVVSAAQAVQLIRDGDAVASGGFVGIGFAENLAVAPIIVLLGKHLLQDLVMSKFRGLLMDQLRGLGCKSRSLPLRSMHRAASRLAFPGCWRHDRGFAWQRRGAGRSARHASWDVRQVR